MTIAYISFSPQPLDVKAYSQLTNFKHYSSIYFLAPQLIFKIYLRNMQPNLRNIQPNLNLQMPCEF